MVRLIVEEAGERRAFRLGEGVLSVGSGEGARLRLASPDVADVHAEVELSGAAARLRARPGVLPPTVGGAPVVGEVPLALGVPVRIGSATLWLQADEGPIEAPAALAPPPAAPGRPGAPPALAELEAQRSARRDAAIRAARKGAPRSVVQSRRPTVQRGMPGWAIAMIVLLVAAAAVYFLMRGVKSSGQHAATSDAPGVIAAARGLVEQSNFDSALARLDSIPASADLSPADRQAILDLRKEIQGRRDRIALDLQNQAGSKWLDTYLQTYETKYLQGKPDPAKVRLFLKRCRTFRERWPQHPQLDWIQRQETRFAGTADPDAPPTWEDVDWEIHFLTQGKPRDYRQAFALLDEYEKQPGAKTGDADDLRKKLVDERKAFQADQLQWARYWYDEKQQTDTAIGVLVDLIWGIGDPDMANEAAGYLVKLPLEPFWKGYQEQYPEKYQALVQNPVVAAWAKEKGLL